MRVTVIAVVTSALGTVRKGLEKEKEESKIRGRIETIKTIALLRSAKILKKFLETQGDLMLIRLQ